MEGLCLLLAALSATVPPRASNGADAITQHPPGRERLGGTRPRALRLGGGRSLCEGRVELEQRDPGGQYVTTAGTMADADVVCRQLAAAVPCAPPSHKEDAGVVCSVGDTDQSGTCSLGLQPPTPMTVVTLSNVTVPSASEGSPPAGTLSPLPMSLFACLVLAALLLLAMLAFTAALLRVRKMSAHALSLGLSGPVLVTHSAQSPDVSSGTSNDYRETPRSLPKGPEPPVTATKDSDDSDYEHYDFSRQPPVALSTFYNSLRRPPGEQLVPLLPNWDGLEPFPAEAPARLGPTRGRTSSSSTSSSSSSSTEPYCNGSTCPPQAWVVPPPPTEGTHLGFGTHPPTGVPVPPAAPSAADSSSTSSGEWYENVPGGTQPPGDPAPHPAEPHVHVSPPLRRFPPPWVRRGGVSTEVGVQTYPRGKFAPPHPPHPSAVYRSERP
ncbi:LOW QUALITY PROTEIN: T-cell differentiation antigen CD6 [Pterocles gutturalis]